MVGHNTLDKNAFKSGEFCLASDLRIGQSLPYSKYSSDCGAEINEHGYYLSTGKFGLEEDRSGNKIYW